MIESEPQRLRRENVVQYKRIAELEARLEQALDDHSDPLVDWLRGCLKYERELKEQALARIAGLEESLGAMTETFQLAMKQRNEAEAELAERDEAIERLKCCANCGHRNDGRGYFWCGAGWKEECALCDPCHFTNNPVTGSRWSAHAEEGSG